MAGSGDGEATDGVKAWPDPDRAQGRGEGNAGREWVSGGVVGSGLGFAPGGG